MPSRRDLIRSLPAGFLAWGIIAARNTEGGSGPKAFARANRSDDRARTGETIGMLLYPGFTALDLFGPHHMFGNVMGAKVMLLAEKLEPVASDLGVAVIPTTTLEDCPERLTVLFVPGGTTGTLAAAESEKIRSFVRDRGGKAEWVTSVCTGSIVLGAAGLLRGYKATSHWIARERLVRFGAIPVAERVVIDRNRVTGAGVTSGLDFGLTLVEKLRGTEYAQAVQLLSEYDPRPPLDAGSEKKAPARVSAMLREMLGDFNARVDALADEIEQSKAGR